MISKEFLIEEYITKDRSAIDIAKQLGYSSASTVHRKLDEYNIPKKNGKTKLITKEILEELYCNRTLTIREISENLKVSCSSIKDYIKKYQLTRDKVKRLRNVWKGYKDISGKYYYTLKYRASNKNLDFDLELTYLWELFQKQNGKCIYTDMPLEFAKECSKEGMLLQTASLDRRDSSKGYIKDNVQWVHKIINQMKWQLSHEDFINYCKLVSQNLK